MITLQTKIDYALTDEGKVFARELNLIGGSLKNIIQATGDTRPGPDNAEAVLGAIDDISRSQLFKLTGPVLSRYLILDSNITDPMEMKTGQMISIYVDDINPMLDTISINGVSYSVTTPDGVPSEIIQRDPAIMVGIVDSVANSISILDTGANTANGLLDIKRTILIENATYNAPVDVDIDGDGILLLVEQSTTPGSPKVININTTLVDGSFVILENLGNNEVVDTIVNFSSPIKDIGSSLLLNTVSFRVKIFVENNELKSELVTTDGGSLQPASYAALDVTYNNTSSGLAATDVQLAIDEVAANSSTNGADIITLTSLVNTIDTDYRAAADEVAALASSVNVLSSITKDNIEFVQSIGYTSVGFIINGRLFTSAVNNDVYENQTSGIGESGIGNTILGAPIPGLSNLTDVRFPDEDFSVNKITSIGYHTQILMYALFDNGNLYVWGGNAGTLGLGHNVQVDYPTLTNTNVARIANTGSTYGSLQERQRMVVEKMDGSIEVVGSNDSSVLGLGAVGPTVSAWTTLLSIIPGTVRDFWLLGRDKPIVVYQLFDGTILVCGHNAYGALGLGHTGLVTVPTDATAAWGNIEIASVHGVFGYVDPATGLSSDLSTLAILGKDGSLRLCGEAGYGQIGNGSFLNTSIPQLFVEPNVTVQSPIVEVSGLGHATFLALTASGKLYGWGANETNPLNNIIFNRTAAPILIDSNVKRILSKDWSRAWKGLNVTAFWERIDGEVWSSGLNTLGQRGDGTVLSNAISKTLLPKDELIKFLAYMDKAVTNDDAMLVAVTESNNVYAWGSARNSSMFETSREHQVIPRLIAIRNIKG